MKVEITIQKFDTGPMLLIKGDVDMNSSPDVRNSLDDIFKQGGAKALLINLSGVRYMDSSGIATLVEAMQNCMKQGMKLRLVELSPPVRDVFEIFSSVNEARTGI
jgi:anti-sigma B factor antagonist